MPEPFAGFDVLRCPLPASIQDLGRPGYRHLGVPLSGALDNVSLRLANALVKNPPDAAALEMRLRGPRLRAQTALRIALAHADAVVERADGARESLPAWRSARLARGDVLDIGRVRGGAGYLAVAGGFAVPPQLGSRSACARAGLGGPLREGLHLPVGEASHGHPEHPDHPDCAVLPAPTFADSAPLRVIPGPQRERFTDAAFAIFTSATYTVARDADRMGLRLDGPRLEHCGAADIVSDAVAPGAIQVPGDGRPIVLLADCQSVGGYAKIATVITADLPRLGRLLPGDAINFAEVDIASAKAALHEREIWLAVTIGALRPLADGIDLTALYCCNLIDGVVHAD